MQNWADGYITELPYTRNFFPELSPAHLCLVCSLAGVAPPQLTEGFDYCELGCGQGLTTALLAASFPRGRFWGVDFNPTHIGLAQKFAQRAGIDNLTFLDASFEEILEREDLPSFDFIALHGIYSWVSRAQRQNILRFLHRCLKPGGVVYNSYNAKPGKTNLEPIRRLFKELTPAIQNPGQKVAAGLDLLETLVKNPRGVFQHLNDFPQMVQRLKQQSPQYVVHEFLNEHWKSFYCTDVFRDMAGAKLTYVGSADPGLNFDALSVPAPYLQQYQDLGTLDQRQLFRDLLLNTSFRKDVYVRGPVPLSPEEHRQINTTIVLGRSPFHQKFQGVYRCGAGEVDMTKDKLTPLVYERLSGSPLPLAELVRGMEGMDPAQVMNCVRHLLTSGQIRTMGTKTSDTRGLSRVNQLSLDQSAHDFNGAWLCSETLGNAFLLPFVQALMLKAHLAPQSKETVPETVVAALTQRGASFRINDHEITEPADILRHIKALHKEFTITLTELKRLGIL